VTDPPLPAPQPSAPVTGRSDLLPFIGPRHRQSPVGQPGAQVTVRYMHPVVRAGTKYCVVRRAKGRLVCGDGRVVQPTRSALSRRLLVTLGASLGCLPSLPSCAPLRPGACLLSPCCVLSSFWSPSHDFVHLWAVLRSHSLPAAKGLVHSVPGSSDLFAPTTHVSAVPRCIQSAQRLPVIPKPYICPTSARTLHQIDHRPDRASGNTSESAEITSAWSSCLLGTQSSTLRQVLHDQFSWPQSLGKL
jgi:hypothetical protein